MPAYNINIYAKWTPNDYTIDFVENGGSEVASITQGYETTIVMPSDPTRTGYSFAGWYSDPELTIPYVISTMPLDGITLYAEWTINEYTISFNENGGSLVDDITQNYATSILEPENPTRVGFTFLGWYSNTELMILYEFLAMPAENITLTALWQVNNYTIFFQENGGSVVADFTAAYGSSISAPISPTKSGYTFAGWYANSELTTEYLFTTMPPNDISPFSQNGRPIFISSHLKKTADRVSKISARPMVLR
ncbi:MAG: InlB B-repeat-containing protein [Bacillus subtilis]|nr:InlB B-repeat-containing protein [Bacillus subtilis]